MPLTSFSRPSRRSLRWVRPLLLASLQIWVQPERPSKQLRAALGGLKGLHLSNIYPEYNYLSWTTFLLEAAPLLEALEIHVRMHMHAKLLITSLLLMP